MKTLRKAYEKLELSQYFAKFLNIHTILRREKFPATEGSPNTVDNPRNAMHFAVLSQGGFAVKCTIFRWYNSHLSLMFAIICNSCFSKSRRCAPWCAASIMGWRWSFGRLASSAAKMTWRPNWMSQHGLPLFSAGERYTLSVTQNSFGNPHARIYFP